MDKRKRRMEGVKVEAESFRRVYRSECHPYATESTLRRYMPCRSHPLPRYNGDTAMRDEVFSYKVEEVRAAGFYRITMLL